MALSFSSSLLSLKRVIGSSHASVYRLHSLLAVVEIVGEQGGGRARSALGVHPAPCMHSTFNSTDLNRESNYSTHLIGESCYEADSLNFSWQI